MKYNVLKIVYTKAGKNEKGEFQYEVSWTKIGKANSMEHAKRKFGGAPVLEEAV